MFKRLLYSFLAVLGLLIPLTAHAEWVTKEIQWRQSGVGPLGTSTGIWVRDTIKTAVGVDTTSVFTLDNATVPPRGAAGTNRLGASGTTGQYPPNSADTTVVAWIIIQSDSSAATTATATNLTAIIDGRVGGFGSGTYGNFPATLGEGWVKADSVFINGAAGGHFETGNDSYGFPIFSISPYGNVLRWPELRARITVATGSIPAARVFLRYYRPNVSNEN